MKEKKHYSIHKVEDMNIYGEYNGNFYPINQFINPIKNTILATSNLLGQ